MDDPGAYLMVSAECVSRCQRVFLGGKLTKIQRLRFYLNSSAQIILFSTRGKRNCERISWKLFIDRA